MLRDDQFLHGHMYKLFVITGGEHRGNKAGIQLSENKANPHLPLWTLKRLGDTGVSLHSSEVAIANEIRRKSRRFNQVVGKTPIDDVHNPVYHGWCSRDVA